MLKSAALAVLASLTLSACVQGTPPETTGAALPLMQWDHQPEGDEWTVAALQAVALYDDALAGTVPHDVAAWCPGYAMASLQDRRAFWVGMFSALAKHESTWNERAAGGGGRWIGLTQISPDTARNYGCEATTAEALKDGAQNLACAVRIAAHQVGRDDMVAGGGSLGLGRDWAPFRKASKREDMEAWISEQPYCRADNRQRLALQ